MAERSQAGGSLQMGDQPGGAGSSHRQAAMPTEPDLATQRGHRGAMRRGYESFPSYQAQCFGDQGGVIASDRHHPRMPTPNPHSDTATTQIHHIACLSSCDRGTQQARSQSGGNHPTAARRLRPSGKAGRDPKRDLVAQCVRGDGNMLAGQFPNRWAFSVATALAQGLPPLAGAPSKWGHKFVDTRHVQVPERLYDFLAIAAFHHSEPEDPEIQNPGQIILISNGLAGAGCPSVLERLNSPKLYLTPLAKALDFAASMLNEPPAPATEASTH